MNAYVEAVVQNVLPVLVTFLLPIVSVLAAWVLKKVKDKTGLDIAASQQKMLIDAIDHGIGSAEQWALSKAKMDPASAPQGAQKLEKALEFINGVVVSQKLDVAGRDELVKLIEARLGVQAIQGS